MAVTCDACKRDCIWAEFGSGHSTCTECGNIQFSGYFDADAWRPSENLVPRVTYTRRKRFKKYMARACQQQSSSTVPDATWKYLLDRAPYRSPQHIVRTLKKAKGLKKKCYDSLPVLTANLCDVDVPTLTDTDTDACYRLFDVIDQAVPQGQPFVSYMFTLEYILHKIDRTDVLPYLSRIQCRKRRVHYNGVLDGIFGTHVHVPAIVYM